MQSLYIWNHTRVEPIIIADPSRKYPFKSTSFKSMNEKAVDNKIEIDIANPLIKLSAYVITAAIARPPIADRNTIIQTRWL